MASTKKTINLPDTTLAYVRYLVGKVNLPPSQDGVVREAIDRLYRAIREVEEGEAWEATKADSAYQAELTRISAEFSSVEGL